MTASNLRSGTMRRIAVKTSSPMAASWASNSALPSSVKRWGCPGVEDAVRAGSGSIGELGTGSGMVSSFKRSFGRTALGPNWWMDRAAGFAFTIRRPAIPEARQPSVALSPANPYRVRPLLEAARARTKMEVTPSVVHPAAQNAAPPVKIGWCFRPHPGQRAAFTAAAVIPLRRRVIVRMRHDRFGRVNHSRPLRPAPAGVFFVFGVLDGFIETAFGPDRLSNAAAGHAKEVFPPRRLAVRAEAAFVIM